MKKQIIYPTLIPRIFASTLDLALIAVPAYLIINFISLRLSLLFFKVSPPEMLKILMQSAENSASSVAAENINFSNLLSYNILMYLATFIIYGLYFVGCWNYYGATPGKIIMHMRIVDAVTFAKPKKWQLIKRFCGYISALFGIWSIVFSKQRQALHDKIAGTVVIKS